MADDRLPTLAELGRQASESLYEYLERRERELAARSAAVRGELEAMETELAHVRSARRQIGNLPGFGRHAPAPPTDQQLEAARARNEENRKLLAQLRHPSSAPSNPPTIKDMILKALWAGFRETGATQAELRRFISDAYGRDLERTSMSPQISRMREEGLIKQKGGEDNWRLTIKALEQFSGDSRYGSGEPGS